MFTGYLSVCRTADNMKPTTHILTAEEFGELYEQIEDKGLRADYFFENLGQSPLNTKGKWEYKAALTLDSFIWVISHNDDSKAEVAQFFEGLKEKRVDTTSEVLTVDRYDELIKAGGHDKMPQETDDDEQNEQALWQYMQGLHDFHCQYIAKN